METGGGFGGKEEYPSIVAGACRAPGVEVWPAGQARLRSRRGHGRVDQAASVANAASDRGVDRRPAARHGDRLRHRRRRLLHAVAGGVVARHDSRRRAVLLPERAAQRPRRRDQRAAARRVSRLRRAAEPVRARAPHGSRRGRRRSDPGRAAPPQFHPPRADERRRPGDPRSDRHGRAARSRDDDRRLPREARTLHRGQPGVDGAEGHRPRDFHARRRLHRFWRGPPARPSSRSRPTATATSGSSRPTPRSARAPSRSSRRSPRTRSACRPT